MSKLIIIAVVLAAAIALATAAGENYIRYTTFDSADCAGPEVASTFRTTECLFYNSAYSYYECKDDGVYYHDCATDSYCTSCTTSKASSFGCSNFQSVSCTNDEYANLYNANAPVSYAYAQKDCKSKNLLTVTAYNTSATNTNWAECSNGEFYLNTCANGNCTARVKQPLECTYDSEPDESTENACGWPSSAAQLVVGVAAIFGAAALLF